MPRRKSRNSGRNAMDAAGMGNLDTARTCHLTVQMMSKIVAASSVAERGKQTSRRSGEKRNKAIPAVVPEGSHQVFAAGSFFVVQENILQKHSVLEGEL